MAFPLTIEEMNSRGYVFKNESDCSACHARIDWYKTPAGKFIPINKGTAEPHWASCPNAKDFRQAKTA
jgi:hypothetical protein